MSITLWGANEQAVRLEPKAFADQRIIRPNLAS